jgi:opacity protein-like surface antigen
MNLRRLALSLLAIGPVAFLPAAARAGELAFEAQGGYLGLNASNSASALFDSTGAPTFGGAVRLTFWRGAFVTLGGRTFTRDGERVFVASANAPVEKLGFGLTMRTTPLFAMAGYRLRRGSLLVPYLAAGVAVTRYSESSQVAGEAFDQQFTKTGFTGVVGLELGRGLFRVGGEAGYTTVPNAIGFGGVSKVYSENDIGGWHVVGKLVVSFNGHEPTPKPGPAVAKPKP